jgi:hypothetical protein
MVWHVRVAFEVRQYRFRALGLLSSRFAAVLGILPGLGEVGIRVFQQGILIPVAQLALQSRVPWDIVDFGFDGAFGLILIACGMWHVSTSNSR